MAALGNSALGLVLGATEPEATVAFLSAFGLGECDRRDIDAATAGALYGLGSATTEIELSTTGTDASKVWVVAGEAAGIAPTDFERRPRAFDIYTSSVDDAIDHLRFVGLAPGPVGTLAVGPVTMRQCLVEGPDGTSVVLVESSHRRSSLLDADSDHDAGPNGAPRLFSEGHSVVWCVESMDEEASLLSSAGLTKGMDLAFSEPEVSTYLGLPRSPVPIRMTMLSGESVEPLRLELLEFVEDDGPTEHAEALRGGIWALRLPTGDPSASAEILADHGCVATGSAAGCEAVRTPGGIRLQLVV
ncbi:MAG: hypothetical protein ACR2OH_14335 [Microthrixaceae bacterium]